MSEPQLQPYLCFDGNCEEAMNFYKNALGGELEISRFADFASSEMPVADDQKGKVMHATLKNDTLTFMASDGMPDRAVSGDRISMSIAGNDENKLTTYFNKLSEGGSIDMPLSKQVWGDIFGMFTDKYGIHWMVNISSVTQDKN